MDQATTRPSETPYPRADVGIGDDRLFSMAMVISGIRCLLAYIVLPFVIPILGLAPSVGPWLGIVIGLVAIAANVYSIRRFSRSKHRWRKPVIALNVGVIGLLVVLLVLDVSALISG